MELNSGNETSGRNELQTETQDDNIERTRPSRPKGATVWSVERMRHRSTDQPTNRPIDLPIDQRTQLVIEVLCRT